MQENRWNMVYHAQAHWDSKKTFFIEDDMEDKDERRRKEKDISTWIQCPWQCLISAGFSFNMKLFFFHYLLIILFNLFQFQPFHVFTCKWRAKYLNHYFNIFPLFPSSYQDLMIAQWNFYHMLKSFPDMIRLTSFAKWKMIHNEPKV